MLLTKASNMFTSPTGEEAECADMQGTRWCFLHVWGYKNPCI